MRKSAMLACALFFAGAAAAHDSGIPAGPDSHAPIGVMGDHTHGAGEVMFSWRYMRMDMEGNRDGTDSLSTADVLTGYMVAPESMRMDMHMFGAMYAPGDALTLMAMLPLIDISMQHVTRMGMHFTTRSSGIGDLKLAALYSLHKGEGRTLHLNLVLGVPTGSIDARDDTPAMRNAVLPYPMQPGSGTWDPAIGLTWRGMEGRFSWGAQGVATFRTGENDRGYTLGNRLDASFWTAWRFSPAVSGSLRLAAARWDDIDGADAALDPMMVPTADPELRGGTRADLGLGLNFRITDGSLQRNRFALEYLVPVHQDLDGPQLGTDSILTLGWQYDFTL